MKKILVGLTFLTAVSSATFFSCKKSEINKQATASNQSTSKVSSETLEKIKTTTSSFIIKEHSHNFTKRPQWLQTILDDLSGAAKGAPLAVINPALGVGAAITCGIISSMKAVYQNNSNSSNNQIRNISFPISSTVSNSNNPYDYVGYWHYYTLNSALSNTSNYEDINDSFSYCVTYSFISSTLTSNNVFGGTSFSSIIGGNYSTLKSDFNYVASLSTTTCSSALYQMHSDGYINDVQYSVLSDYFDAIDNSNSASDFATYSVDIENDIVSDTSLSSNDKQCLLMIMSTARYSLQYYSLQ